MVFVELNRNKYFLNSGKASANGSVPKEKGKAVKSGEQPTSGGDALAKEFLVVSKNVSVFLNSI